jgi:hypothetical protein
MIKYFLKICGDGSLFIWVQSQSNEPIMTKDSKIVVFILVISFSQIVFGMNVFKYVIKNTYNFLDTSHFLYNF